MRRVGLARAGFAMLAAACLAVVAAVAVNLASDLLPGRWPVWLLLAVAVMATAATACLSVRGAAPERTIEPDPVEALADVVRRQWEHEARTRDLLRPDPLPVRWSTTRRPVCARAAPFRLSGTGDELVDAFLALPRRQLVVLGDAGSGKTVLAMLLTLGLLNKRHPDAPVPVLLPLAEWDPRTHGLADWLAAQLAADYPGAGPATQRVLPILDGLDELPASMLPLAIDGIDHAMAGGRPFVVTCRGAEYEKAVAAGGVVLSGAVVVELEPVRSAEVLTFVLGRTPVGDTRWEPVCAHLRAAPDGDLAATLSNPLMVWLARHAYTDPATRPAELLTLADRAAIERHLLDAIIPARYARRAGPTAAEAGRWLSFLAAHLVRTGTHDLAWWQLDAALGTKRIHRLAIAMLALTVGLITGLLVLPSGQPWEALGGALTLGLGTALGARWRLARREADGPASLGDRRRGLLRHVIQVFVEGYAVVVGFFMLLVPVFELLSELTVPLSVALGRMAVFGSGVGLVIGGIMAIVVGLQRSTTGVRATTPQSALRDDGLALLSYSVSAGAVIGLIMALATGWWSSRFSVMMSLNSALVAASMAAFGRPASGWYTLAHLALAVRGKLPWRLMRFCADAHELGILRQSGPVYQFRHAMLRDRLAARPSGHGECAGRIVAPGRL